MIFSEVDGIFYIASCKKDDFCEVFFNRNINVSCHLHMHPAAEIVFVLSGELTLIKTHSRITLSAGAMSFIMPYEIHGYLTENRSDMAVLIFPPELISEFDSRFAGKEFADPTTVADVITGQYISSQLGRDGVDIYERKAFIYHAAAQFCRHSELIPVHSGEHDLLLSAIKFISSHYTEDIALKDASRHCGVTSEHLCRVISKNTGMTFLDLLSAMRMQKSRFLLTDTDLPISDVAFESGFGSTRNFNRVFKRFFGITPKDLRSGSEPPKA